jgi:hypothetical protein
MDTDTENEQERFYSVVEQCELPVSAVILIFGTTGNIILIIIITCNKDMRTVSNMYILNVAISDMIYLTVLFLDALRNRITFTWLSGVIGCAFFSFCCQMSVGLTAYSVAVLIIQRYRETVISIHARFSSQPTWRGTGATICGVWVLAVLFAIPAARSRFWCDDSFLRLKNYYQYVAIFQLLVSCVLPLCVIAFSHIVTVRHLVGSTCSASEETQNPQLNTRKNTAKFVLGLTVVLLIRYVLFYIWEIYVFYIINFHNPLAKTANEFVWADTFLDIMLILSFFLSINICLSPVALFCTSVAFRRQFKRYFTCCYKTKSHPTVFEL